MEARRFIEELVPQVTRNASVVRIDEGEESYRVTIAGTTGVEARCELARDTAEAAASRTDARSIVAATLKQCADRTVADVGDGRA